MSDSVNKQLVPYIERARKVLQYEQRGNHQDQIVRGGLEVFVVRWADEVIAACKNAVLIPSLFIASPSILKAIAGRTRYSVRPVCAWLLRYSANLRATVQLLLLDLQLLPRSHLCKRTRLIAKIQRLRQQPRMAKHPQLLYGLHRQLKINRFTWMRACRRAMPR